MNLFQLKFNYTFLKCFARDEQPSVNPQNNFKELENCFVFFTPTREDLNFDALKNTEIVIELKRTISFTNNIFSYEASAQITLNNEKIKLFLSNKLNYLNRNSILGDFKCTGTLQLLHATKVESLFVFYPTSKIEIMTWL